MRQLLAFSRRQTLRPQVLALGDVLSDLSILLDRLLGENVKLAAGPRPRPVADQGRPQPVRAGDHQPRRQRPRRDAGRRHDDDPDAQPRRPPRSPAFRYQPLPRGRLCADRGRGHRHRHDRRRSRRRSSSRSSRPRKSARAPASASPRSTASSSRPAPTSSSTRRLGKGTVFRIFIPRYIPAEGEKHGGRGRGRAEIADLTGTRDDPPGRGRGGGPRLRRRGRSPRAATRSTRPPPASRRSR